MRWADVTDARDGDGVLLTVRTSKTNQEGDAADVRYLKNGAAKAIRTLRAAAADAAPTDRCSPASTISGGNTSRAVDERLELLVVVRQRLGEREEPPDGVLRAAEAHLDPAGLDRHAFGQAGQARLERLDGHRDPHPGEPGLTDRGDDPVAARRLAAEGGHGPVPSELA